MDDYRLIEGAPTVEDYNRVRVYAGLSGEAPEAVKVGLGNTVFDVRVESGDEVAGIGRIVGDGAPFFEVVDIAVLPDHKGKGLGAKILDALTSYLHDNARPGAFVSLVADPGVSEFYEKYGFKVRPTTSPGMSLKIR